MIPAYEVKLGRKEWYCTRTLVRCKRADETERKKLKSGSVG